MKHFGSLCIFLILVHFSTQTPKFENCSENFIKAHTTCECCKVTCSSDGTQASAIACAEMHCQPGTQIGYQDEDTTKEYPDCCGYPICES